MASRELVAAEACYHKSCYRNYTRPTGERVSGTCSADDKEHDDIEFEAHQKLFDYIRSNILGNPRLVKFTEITQQLVLFMEELGANVIRESTKTHLHRKLKTEFKSLLQFEDLLGNIRLFVFLDNLSRIQLAKEIARLLEHQAIRSDPSIVAAIHQVALELRECILSTKDSMSCPPKPTDLTEDATEIPDNVRAFLSTLLTGNMESPKLCSERVQRLVNSFEQDLVFEVAC